MDRRRRSSPAPLAAAAFLAAAALVALAPGALAAGCGPRGHVVDRLGALGLSALAELSGDVEAPSPGRIPPCSGPSCSEGPGVPLAAPLAAPGPWREIWSRPSAAPSPDPRGRFLRLDGGETPKPRSGSADVERPPRRPAA